MSARGMDELCYSCLCMICKRYSTGCKPCSNCTSMSGFTDTNIKSEERDREDDFYININNPEDCPVGFVRDDKQAEWLKARNERRSNGEI